MNGVSSIKVDKSGKIGVLVHEFHQLFPFLSLEFYQKGEPVSYEFQHLPLSHISVIKKACPFEITPKLSVAELEQLFWNNQGVQVAVFRKVGNSLLETSFTTQWTLEHQNSRGNSIFAEFKSS